MYHFVYLKDTSVDRTYKCINPKTCQYIPRLIYAPRFTTEQLPTLKEWIATITDKRLLLQIRVAGTNKIVYCNNKNQKIETSIMEVN